MAARLSTGIKILDDLLKGGIERGSSVLLRSSPFVNVDPIAQQWLYNRLNEGDQGLYFVNNKAPETVLEEMETYGWPAKPFKEEGKLTFIDAYTGILGLKSPEAFRVEDPTKIEEINKVVLHTIRDKGGKNTILFIDSLNTLIDQCGSGVLAKIGEWSKHGVTHDVSGVYIYTEWGYPDEVTSRLEKAFDSILDLKALKRIVASEALTITKVEKKEVKEPKFIPFKYVKPGGLRVYVPKILVTGPYHAGKTTLVHGLSSRAVSVQRMGTTVALDFGHVDHRGFSVDLFGTIGQSRFDPILDQLGGEALGVMLVIDSTKPEEFPRAMEMMQKAGVHGLPYVVLANKQDLPGALSSEEIRKRMHIPEDVVIIETTATEKKNIVRAMDALLEKLMKGE